MQELLDEEITPLEEKINLLLDTKRKQEEQEEEILTIKNNQSELHRKCLKIEWENNKLKKRIEHLECKMLEGNLIMHSLREDEWELEENRKEQIYQAIAPTLDYNDRHKKLNIARSIPIRNTHWLGKYKAGKNRHISITFEKKSHADQLFESKSWLPKGIYVDKEYTQEVENQCKLLCPFLKLVRSIETYQGKWKLEDNHLVIHGKKYTVEDLHKLPNDLSGFHASSKSTDKAHAFFGKLSPFNNFHKATFKVDNTTCFCSEQYIQAKKAQLFHNNDTMDKIMVSLSPLKCKDLGRDVQNYSEEKWKLEAENLCLPGLMAKFEQNPCFTDILLSTGSCLLAEASYDTMWGTGIPLHHQDCLDERKWKGSNLLGKLLMYIRKCLLERRESGQASTTTSGNNA